MGVERAPSLCAAVALRRGRVAQSAAFDWVCCLLSAAWWGRRTLETSTATLPPISPAPSPQSSVSSRGRSRGGERFRVVWSGGTAIVIRAIFRFVHSHMAEMMLHM